jgi:hypothetical protein
LRKVLPQKLFIIEKMLIFVAKLRTVRKETISVEKYMAKNKKRKPAAAVHHGTLKEGISKTQFERGCIIARKMMQFLGFEPALFDSLSKKQKQILLNNESPLPIVRAKKGHSVPRQFIRNIHTAILAFMKTGYLDEAAKLTYMEMVTYGLPFMLTLKIKQQQGLFTHEQEETFIHRLVERFNEANLINEGGLENVFFKLSCQVSLYSQVNFRTYGYCHVWDTLKPKDHLGLGILRLAFELTAHENERTYFTYNGKSRLAYRVIIGRTWQYLSSPVGIRREKLFPGVKSDKMYNLYIQAHVIHRFKERVDFFETTDRNHFINTALTTHQRVVRNEKGALMLACTTNEIPLGYLPFTIQGDNLFVRSFLPFVSDTAPEGEKLHKILNLSKEELVYLGMDKLSFYVLVDFDQIPVLKEALIASGIWRIKEELDAGTETDGFDMKRTSFVKDFFQKLETREIALPAEYEEEN